MDDISLSKRAPAYEESIDKIILALSTNATPTEQELLHYQERLDRLASVYQYDKSLDTKRYKLYQAQAMLYYRNSNDVAARRWIEEAINMRGESYPFAEEFLEHLNQDRPRKSVRKWVVLIVLPMAMLILVALLQVAVRFTTSTVTGSSTTSYATTTTSNSSAGSIGILTLNIFIVLVGIVSLVLLVLTPVWILMLVKTTSYNNALEGYNLSKTTAVVLAVLFGTWTWLYTYERDKTKFWVNIALTVVTFTIWSVVAWIWAIIDTTSKSDEYYRYFPDRAS